MVYEFNAIKMSAKFFVYKDKSTVKFIWKCEETRTKIILKKNTVEEVSLPDFKILYSYGKQDCSASEEIDIRSLEQNRGLGTRSIQHNMCKWFFLQMCKSNCVEKK